MGEKRPLPPSGTTINQCIGMVETVTSGKHSNSGDR